MRRLPLCAFALAGLIGLSPVASAQDDGRVPVDGRACYSHGDNESPLQAANAALDLARQRAVESHQVFVESLGAVKDFVLEKQMVRRLAAGSLYNVQILDQTEDGRRHCATLTAMIDPAEVERAIADMRRLAREEARRQATQAQAATDAGPAAPSRPAGTVASTNPACDYEVPTRISLREAVYPEQPVAEVRGKLLEQASAEAVRSVRGALVQSKSAMMLKADNDTVDERFMSKLKAQSHGLVRYEVAEERMEDLHGRAYLVLDVDAFVCIPRRGTLKRTVAVTSALSSRGEYLPDMADLLTSTFGGPGPFSVIDPQTGMVEVALTGRINNVAVTTVETPRALRQQLGNKAPRRMHRVSVELTLSATETASGETITEYVSRTRSYPDNRDAADVASEFVLAQMRDGVAALHRKAVAEFAVTEEKPAKAADGGAPAAAPAKPKQASGPQW